MGEQCRDCDSTRIHGYTDRHGDPLCYQHFEEYVEDVWDGHYGGEDYSLEDALLDNEDISAYIGEREC